MGSELIWDGKYDAAGNRVPLPAEPCDPPLTESERIEQPRRAAADHQQLDLIETTEGPQGDFCNRLILGDNALVMAQLLHEFRGAVDLVYIDPPFNVGTDFLVDVATGDGPDSAAFARSMLAYRDSWGQGTSSYLQMIYQRLNLLKELLSDRGTIYVHCDYRVNFYLRAMLDEVFGPENYRNELIWCYRGGGVPKNDFAAKHDTIYRYSKSQTCIFNADEVRLPYSPDVQASLPSRYDKSYRANKVYEGYRPNALGKHPEDWWLIQPIMPSDRTERLDYPTQKPVELIQRIIDASSTPDSLVLDAFCGSGTTLAVAEGLRVKREMAGGKPRLRYYHIEPRRWIGIDIGRFAVHTSRKRLIELQRTRQKHGAAYRSFAVFDVRPAQRRRWFRMAAGERRHDYCRLVLEAFGATPGNPDAHRPAIDGQKAGIPCHVVEADSVFTRPLAEELLEQLAADHIETCYCLAWTFAANLPLEIEGLEQKHGAHVHLVEIPPEIIDAPSRKAPWFQAARLNVEPIASRTPAGMLLDVRLESYVRQTADAAEGSASRLSPEPGAGIELIDFWAVDFEWREDRPFVQHWQDYRTRKKLRVERTSGARHVRPEGGELMIAVKVIDVYGFETVVTVDGMGREHARYGN